MRIAVRLELLSQFPVLGDRCTDMEVPGVPMAEVPPTEVRLKGSKMAATGGLA